MVRPAPATRYGLAVTVIVRVGTGTGLAVIRPECLTPQRTAPDACRVIVGRLVHPSNAEESTMAAIRRAEATWSGALSTGSGAVSAVSSGSFSDLPVSWGARTESPEGKTSPEELVAAAHASCFAMALSGDLGRAGTPPERLAISAEVTFDKTDDGWRVVSSALTVRGVVPGMSEADFVAAAEAARDGCPISQALKGNVALSVDAALEG